MPRPSLGETRREEILAAFEACVVEKGLANTTLADVARAANQARPLVRHFIGNRRDMVACLIDRVLARGEAHLKSLGDASPEQVVDILLDQIFADPVTNIVMIELWQMSQRDDALRTQLVSVYARIIDQVSAHLAQGPDATDPGRRHDTAFTAVSLAIGAALFRKLGLEARNPAHLRQVMESLLPAHSPSKP